MKTFLQWLEMVGTSVVFDPKAKGEFNWQGSPGSLSGKTIDGDPIIKKTKRKSKKKKKKSN
jgi:hypothetical protein